MKTEDLIARLGGELTPVRVLAPAWRRAAVWAACSSVYVALVVAWKWLWRESGAAPMTPPFLLQESALIATAYGAAVAAFASVIPGRSNRVQILPVISAAAVMVALAWGAIADLQTLSTLGIGRETDWPCVLSIAIGSTLLWGMAMLMLKRGAPLTPGLTTLLAGAAALSVANAEACITRGHAFMSTIILWHGLTTAVVLLAMTRIGRALLRW